MIECEYCTGSRWLADNTGMGECACVNRDNVVKMTNDYACLEHQIDAQTSELEELTTAMQDALDALRAYFVSIGWPSHPVRINDQNLSDAYTKLDIFE